MAQEMGISREELYKSFSSDMKPNIETIMNELDKLGMRLMILPKDNKPAVLE